MIKGQKASRESVEEAKRTKLKNLISKYNWGIVEPFLDNDLNNGSRNRNLKFLTLREYKEKMTQGISHEDMKKEGISKHILQFFSNFCQGKINLTKEKFESEYLSGKSIEQIGDENKITRSDITFLRQLYNIDAKGAKYQNRKRTESLLTEYQKEVLYGSMLGDAYRMSLDSVVAFKHCSKQKDYLLWKYEVFKNIASENSLKGELCIDKRTEKQLEHWRFYCHANSDVEDCIIEFYKTGSKQVTEKILNNLTPLSIAVWYMDDGTTGYGHNNIIKSHFNITPIMRFCTNSFSLESCNLIKDWFYKKYNIKTKIFDASKYNKTGNEIVIENESQEDFVKLIQPYILPMFKYKINYKEYTEDREKRSEEILFKKSIKCPLGADFSSLSLSEQEDNVKNIVEWFHSQGFNILMDNPKKWVNEMNNVINYDCDKVIKKECITFSNLGNRFLMSHFPSFWSAKSKGNMSPKEIFENKSYLSEIIRKIILKNSFPSEHEVLLSLQRYRGNKAVSGFMPTVAKLIYHRYCDPNSKVIDFCSGYGGRLFGAISCDKVESYTGIEINFDTFLGLQDLCTTLRKEGNIKKNMTIINQDSISGMKQFADKSFDFCFTSPPFFDAEIYGDDKNQSCNKFTSYSEWFEEYLINSIREATRISKKVAINICNIGGYLLADDFSNWLNKNNIKFTQDKIKTPQRNGGSRLDPIFIFSI